MKKFLALALIFFCIFSISYSQECVTPCPEDTACQRSFCDQGVCKTEPIVPIPLGCCATQSHCEDTETCTLSECNLQNNECEIFWICEDTPPTYIDRQPQSCKNSNDCDDGVYCTTDICRDGFCVSDVVVPLPEGCCQSQLDCPTFPCTFAFCNFAENRCVYRRNDNGCSIPNPPSFLTDFSSSSPSSSSPSDDDVQPEIGDIVGAIIGFIILGILVVAFIIIVILIIVRNIITKVTGESS
eukprot:TRINITY_DN47228_c4_g1_i1.p1 TRINITY_DN47228_c4_g1~~TRINITY_DN47228_c4_g1_i1.p1  ORF type:complete len:241 (+),score=39.45 TRINITY_DN47228_c4_g1_i1:82-804(+)